jgi:uncharacterized SAM-binding protein YcdF (DUF218 family)
VTGLENSAVEGVARLSRKRRSRWLLPAVLVAILVILTLGVFRQQVLTGLGESLVVSDPLEHADLIYVFAGDFLGSRVLLGAQLGSQGWAPTVVLSGGPYQGHCACDLSVDFAMQHGYPRSLFLPVPMEAQSTLDEAQAMRPLFHRLGARRIILVTSNFHSRRAAQVFRLFLPEFDFRMESSPDNDFHPDTWWQNPSERRLLFSEYQKMIGTFLVRFHLASADWLRRNQQ